MAKPHHSDDFEKGVSGEESEADKKPVLASPCQFLVAPREIAV
ncbi:MAG: hypothetical protein RI556_01965 [Hydrogenovibrio sp.]|nr:hypothetical protein [Hydrogenovibrio sp.]MDR9497915.1 hypothetical protein [Hydrogenovibrio sp.]